MRNSARPRAKAAFLFHNTKMRHYSTWKVSAVLPPDYSHNRCLGRTPTCPAASRWPHESASRYKPSVNMPPPFRARSRFSPRRREAACGVWGDFRFKRQPCLRPYPRRPRPQLVPALDPTTVVHHSPPEMTQCSSGYFLHSNFATPICWSALTDASEDAMGRGAMAPAGDAAKL